MDTREEVFDQWLELIENGELARLKRELNEDNPANIAEFFEEIPVDKQLLVFRLLTKDNAADTFSFMDSDTQVLALALHPGLGEMKGAQALVSIPQAPDVHIVAEGKAGVAVVRQDVDVPDDLVSPMPVHGSIDLLEQV